MTKTKTAKGGYVPFPIGTVRGPYHTENGTQFLVQGAGGWIPFIDKSEKEANVRAHKYAAEVRAKLIDQIAEASRAPAATIVERKQLRYPEGHAKAGEVYSPFHGGPHVAAESYFVYQAPNGTTHGKRYPTRGEAETHYSGVSDKRVAEFKAELETMTNAKLAEQAAYWIKNSVA